MAFHDRGESTDLTGMGGDRMFGASGFSFREKAEAVASAQSRRLARTDLADPVADGLRIAAQLGHCPGAIVKHLRLVEQAALSAAGDVVRRARESGL